MKSDSKKKNRWTKCILFHEFSKEEIQQVEGVLNTVECEEGESIIEEGQKGESVYIIEKGKVEVIKEGVKLGEMGKGEYFGAMALLDQTERSASINTIKPTIFKTITKHKLDALGDDLFKRIIMNHLRTQQNLVRKMTKATIRETKAKLKASEERVKMANFFFFLVLILLVYQLLLGVYIEYGSTLRQGFYRGIVTPAVIFTMVVMGWSAAKKIGIPLSELGLNLNNWAASLKESLIWTFYFLLTIIVVKWILIQILPSYADRSVFESYMLDDSLTPMMLLLYNMIYAIMTPIQEFLARGILQGSLSRIFDDKYSAFYAILLSNLIFSALHLHIDLRFALLTLIPGFFWGYMYDRQQSLLGVSFSHLVIGMFFFLFIGEL